MAKDQYGLTQELYAEMKLLGYIPTQSDVAKLARVLRAQKVDFGETGITAAVLGYLVAKGKMG